MPGGGDTVTIIYPQGCKEVTEDLTPDELIRRLKVGLSKELLEHSIISQFYYRPWHILSSLWDKKRVLTRSLCH